MRTSKKVCRTQKGASLIELMIAILVLAVGLIGSMALAGLAVNTNTRSRRSSTSAGLAEMVLSQISAIPVGGSTTSITLTDCAGTASTVNLSGTSAGAGATLTSSGTVDYTQSFSSVTSGYAMRYAVCDTTNSRQYKYDVRWNIKSIPSSKEEYVVVAARFAGTSTTSSAQVAAAPVNLRTVVGNDGN